VCLTTPPDEKENPHENLIIGKIKKSTAHWTTNNFFVGLLPARFVFSTSGQGHLTNVKMKSRAAHIGVVVVTSAFIFVTFFIRPITPTGKDKKTNKIFILFSFSFT
jgi:hypothetical protein